MFLGNIERRRYTQEDFARLCRVHLKTISKWVNGREITRNTLSVVADAIEQHFKAENVRVNPEDVSAEGLVDKIRVQLEDSVDNGAERQETASQRSLAKVLDDVGIVRILGIDANLAGWLRSQVGNFRPDLTDQDWAEVVRLIRAGRWDADGYLFMDPQVVTAQMHFKLPPGRLLTDKERWKIQKVAQAALDKLWDEKHNEEKSE